MTTLRSRLLTTCLLAAVLTAAVGIGSASARARGTASHHLTLSSSKTPPVTPYSGEPDAGGGTLPKATTNLTGVNPAGTTVVIARADVQAWMVRLWALWLARR